MIELLIVMGIVLLLAAVAVPIYGNLQSRSYLNERAAEIAQTLRLAKIRSIARVNDKPHGVYFDIITSPDKFILYQGTSFYEIGRDTSYDRTVTLEDSLSLSTTLAGDDINFSRGLGKPNAFGNVVLTNAVGQSMTIAINNYGAVDSN